MHSVESLLRTIIQSKAKAAHTQGEKEQAEETVDEQKGSKEAECILSKACSKAAMWSEANATQFQEEKEKEQAEQTDKEKGKKREAEYIQSKLSEEAIQNNGRRWARRVKKVTYMQQHVRATGIGIHVSGPRRRLLLKVCCSAAQVPDRLVQPGLVAA
jgi:hypothetical protein